MKQWNEYISKWIENIEKDSKILQKEAHLDKGNATKSGNNGTNYVTDLERGGMPAKAGKYHDYFTSALPSPQKGSPISIPLGTEIPVTTNIK